MNYSDVEVTGEKVILLSVDPEIERQAINEVIRLTKGAGTKLARITLSPRRLVK